MSGFIFFNLTICITLSFLATSIFCDFCCRPIRKISKSWCSVYSKFAYIDISTQPEATPAVCACARCRFSLDLLEQRFQETSQFIPLETGKLYQPEGIGLTEQVIGWPGWWMLTFCTLLWNLFQDLSCRGILHLVSATEAWAVTRT